MQACPKCGRPESSFDGETFCDECERRYQQEQADWNDAEIARLRAEIRACCGYREEYCSICVQRHAQLLSISGREAEAISFLNQ